MRYVEFLLDYKPEDSYVRVRDIFQIAKRYLRTQFIFDFIPMLPFHLFTDHPQRKLFFMIKVIRIQKGRTLFSSNSFMKLVKESFQWRLEKYVLNDRELREDQRFENNQINLILKISYVFQTVKLIVLILTVSYFIGMIWYIFCEITLKQPTPQDEHQGFILEFSLNENTDLQNMIIMMYYAFTTLSTVGFGDFHPRSNSERVFCAFILLVGVAIFSYIMGNFIEILHSIQYLNADFDEGESLSKWFGLIKRFNSSRSISMDLK